MKARQVFHVHEIRGDITVEWVLPAPTADRPHGLKYRLYCGSGGRCVVRYDNETGKGDHRHYGRREEAWVFESDCERLTEWVWK
jgi:hypothetical protein